MTNPKPASPLPWEAGDCELGDDTYPHVRDANGDPVTEFNGNDWGDFEDCCYIAWAANNAPALQARIERLEAALREMLDIPWHPMRKKHFDIARRALEAK